MADKVRFLLSSVHDVSTLSEASQKTGLPSENVQDQLIRKVYRTTSKSAQYVVFDAGGATGFNCFFVGNINFTKNAVIKVQANASNSWTTPSVDVTITMETDKLGNPVPKLAHFWDSVQSYRYARFYFDDGGNATSSLEIGRIMFGRYTEPLYNTRDGFRKRFIDPSRGSKTRGRQSYWNERRKYMELSYSVAYAPTAQQNELQSIYSQVGRHDSFVLFYSPESNPVLDTIYTNFEDDISLYHESLSVYNITDVVFSEKN